jgi:hypothetical protein
MRAGGQFRQGDGADRHLVGQFGVVDPFPQDQEAGAEHGLPGPAHRSYALPACWSSAAS